MTQDRLDELDYMSDLLNGEIYHFDDLLYEVVSTLNCDITKAIEFVSPYLDTNLFADHPEINLKEEPFYSDYLKVLKAIDNFS